METFFFLVLLILTSSGFIRAAENEVKIDSIYFPDDSIASSRISKRQVNNILNLVYQMQDRIADNRHSLVTHRQQHQQLLNQSPVQSNLAPPTRSPIQASSPQLLPSTLPSYPSTPSQLYNFNYDPVTDFAWSTFKVSYNQNGVHNC